MNATEKVINDLNVAIFMLGNTQITLNQELRIRIGQAITSAINLLKEQDAEIERLEHELAVTQDNLNYYVKGRCYLR